MRFIRDRLRQVFGIRRERQQGLLTAKPAIGVRIVQGDVRISVQAGLDRELWAWMQERGWREIQHRPDRRRYRDVPASFVTALIDAPADQREAALRAAVAAARRVPVSLRRRGA